MPKGGDRRWLTEARVPNFNGDKGCIIMTWNACKLTCNGGFLIGFLPVETRNSCLSEASSVITFKQMLTDEASIIETRIPNFNGEKTDFKPDISLRHFAFSRHNILLPVEIRNTCMLHRETSSDTTWKVMTDHVPQWGACPWFQRGEERYDVKINVKWRNPWRVLNLSSPRWNSELVPQWGIVCQLKGGDRRRASVRHEFLVSTGRRSIKNPPLRHFACIVRHNTTFLTFLTVEIRNACLSEASSVTTFKMVMPRWGIVCHPSRFESPVDNADE